MRYSLSIPGRSAVLLLLLAAPLAAQTPPVQQPPRDTAIARGDTAAMFRIGVVGEAPALDQARGVDAEVRVALNELLGENAVAALSRLQWLQSSPVAMEGITSDAAIRGREDLLFLLAETYYRLGMDNAFRAAAQQLTAEGSSGRYTPVISSQLLIDAYRRGDHARVVDISRTLSGDAAVRGLSSLVTGLSAYQMGDYASAGTSFAAARQAGEPYAGYAQYMEALARLRVDTAQAAPALAALRALVSTAEGEFRDQVRLTAAQLSYQMGDYTTAASLAAEIPETSPFGAPALFTRAWALYHAEQLQPAGEAFARFADRFPELPERDESRLMGAQVLLQLDRTEDAARLFTTIAEAADREVTVLQGEGSAAMQEAAAALVEARAAGLLFITDPASGKTISLRDAAGADASVLASVFAGAGTTLPPPARPEMLSLEAVSRRLAEVGGPLRDSAFPRRVLFTQASSPGNRAQYGERAQTLYDADVSVALARHRLQEQLDRQALYLAMITRLQEQIEEEMKGFAEVTKRLEATLDSLGRVEVVMEAAAVRLRQMFAGQLSATRLLADENRTSIDSLQRTIGTVADSGHLALLATEAQTAASYRNIADMIDAAVNGLIDRHPAFALRDSVRARGELVAQLLQETQSAASAAGEAISIAVAELENMETEQVISLRAALAAAEERRGMAEAQLIQIVDAELRARAAEMVATLRRDVEAAEFGSASSLFFLAVDSDEPARERDSATDANQAPPPATGSTSPPPATGSTSAPPAAGSTSAPPAAGSTAPPPATGSSSGAAVPPNHTRQK